MSSTKRYRRVGKNGEFEDVDFDPFVSPDEARQRSSDEFRKSHDEQMRGLTKLLESMHEHITAPKRIIRDQQGRAVGMESIHNKDKH